MSRFVLAGLGFVLAVFAILEVAGPASSSTSILQGDTDCNGVVGGPDILPILEHMAGTGDSEGCDPARLDVNCDDEAGIADVLDLLFHLEALSVPTAEPGCTGIGSPVPTSTLTPTPETPTVTPEPATGTSTPPGTTATPENSPTPVTTPRICATTSATPVPTPGSGYHLSQLMACDDFSIPTDFAPVPGHPGEALISTQPGLIWHVSLTNAFPPTLAADLTDRVMRVSDEGLLSVAFQPGNDKFAYVNYNTGTAYDSAQPNFGDPTPNRCDGVPAIDNPPNPKRSVVARFSYNNGVVDTSSQHVVIEIKRPHCWHNVSQLTFDPTEPDIMFIGSGDGGGIGSPYDDHVHPLNNLRGVILRIRIEPDGNYTVPDDNPFVSVVDAMPEIWANEFRHPWRVTVDPETGIVWTGDVGQEKWEEVDKVEAGKSYGWNKMEGNHCYPPVPTPVPTPSETPTPTPVPTGIGALSPCYENGMTLPVAEYSHNTGCAIAVGPVYHGDAMPELGGYLIYGDFCSGRIWALDTTEEGAVPVELVNTVAEIVSVNQTADGEIVVLDKQGEIYQLVHN